jgi:hypothetical protein
MRVRMCVLRDAIREAVRCVRKGNGREKWEEIAPCLVEVGRGLKKEWWRHETNQSWMSKSSVCHIPNDESNRACPAGGWDRGRASEPEG